MARVTIVDDDQASEILVERLSYLGHEARRLRSVDEALEQIETIAAVDLLVLDLLMPRSTHPLGIDANVGRAPGMAVFHSVRRKNSTLPILAFTAADDLGVIDALKRDSHTTFLPKWSTPSMGDVINKIEKILGLEHAKPLPTPFIVHGHDEATKLAVKNYLQNILKLPEPIILHEKPNLGRTLIEKFEHYASHTHLVFVILTPDDHVVSSGASNSEKHRARQNVIFELGFFLGALDRSLGRVVLLHKGALELPSDLTGVIYIDISNGIESAGEQIRKELNDVLK